MRRIVASVLAFAVVLSSACGGGDSVSALGDSCGELVRGDVSRDSVLEFARSLRRVSEEKVRAMQRPGPDEVRLVSEAAKVEAAVTLLSVDTALQAGVRLLPLVEKSVFAPDGKALPPACGRLVRHGAGDSG